MEYGKQGSSGLFTGNYFDSLLVETRLIDSRIADTSIELYGEKFASPIMAAFSHLENGERYDVGMVAKSARKAGVICWVDMEEKEKLSEIAEANAGTVKIIRPYADNKVVISQIKQAQECGVLAVGIDISLAFDSKGGYGRWQGKDLAPKSMEEIREFVSVSSIPFIVKGILSKRDAYKCVMAGAKGIVMSVPHNCGKRVVSPLMALPDVLNAVNKRIPVFVDCEVTNGLDAFKVLAMGASAVFAGQMLLKFSDSGGAEDIYERINSMNDELKSFMAQTGCYDLSHMDKTVFRQI